MIPALAPVTSALAEAATPLLGGTQGPDLTRYLLVCAGLLLAVGGLAWLARRFLAGQMRARAARRSLQVLDVLPLGGKQRLAVVRCYDRTFLLGLGEKEVGLVSELDAVIAPPGPGGATSVEAKSFAHLLRREADRPEVRAPVPQRQPARPTSQQPAHQPAQRGLQSGGILG